jgi:hypothetical protein
VNVQIFFQYISQLNVKLEEDNRALLMQVQALLTQNQELLTQSLESKDHFAEEQKANLYVHVLALPVAMNLSNNNIHSLGKEWQNLIVKRSV